MTEQNGALTCCAVIIIVVVLCFIGTIFPLGLLAVGIL